MYALVAHSSYCSVCLQIPRVDPELQALRAEADRHLRVHDVAASRHSLHVGDLDRATQGGSRDEDLVYSLLLVFSGMLMDEK
ncbi:hypothetical protein ACJX0J_014083, partial [Zea mays]